MYRIKDYVEWENIYPWKTGNNIKNDFLPAYEKGKKIVIDFIGINTISHEFADNLIWAFFFYDGDKAYDRFEFKNCNDEIKKTISVVIQDRLKNNW